MDSPSATATEQARPPRIDAAVHIWAADSSAYPWSPLDGVEPPAAAAEAEDLLATLDRWGFAAAICVQPRAYGYDHTYLEASIRRHRRRLAGVCLVDPSAPDAVPALERHVLEGGCTGVRLIALASAAPAWLAGAAGDAIWDAAAALGIPVSLLVAAPALAAVRDRAARSPATTTVIDHLGLVSPALGPGPRDALLACAEHPNLLVKVSALGALSSQPWPYADLEGPVRDVLAAFGPSRVIFGTDWPHALEHGAWQDQRLAISEAWDLDGADLDPLFGANAARLWKLEPAPAEAVR